MVVFDALAISCDSIHSYKSFVFCEEFGGAGEIGEDEERHETPGNGYASEDYEDVLPFRQSAIYMSDRITNESTKHGRDPVCAVVGFETERLFGGGVPHGHHEDETRVYGCFDGAQQEAVCGHAGEGGASRCADEDYTPRNSSEGEEFADWETLEGVSGGELGEEVAEVED